MKIDKLEAFFSSSAGRTAAWILSLAAGGLLGVVLHFTLYRIALPVEPFIYVAF